MSTSLLTEAPLPALGPYRVRDYDQLPDQPRHELVFGRLYVTPSPFPRHQVVSEVLGLLLDRIADAADGLLLRAPLDVVLADHSVVQPPGPRRSARWASRPRRCTDRPAG